MPGRRRPSIPQRSRSGFHVTIPRPSPGRCSNGCLISTVTGWGSNRRHILQIHPDEKAGLIHSPLAPAPIRDLKYVRSSVTAGRRASQATPLCT